MTKESLHPESVSRQIELTIPHQVRAALRADEGEVAHGLTLIRHEADDPFAVDTEALLCKLKTTAGARIFEQKDRDSINTANRTVSFVGSFKSSPLFLAMDTEGSLGITGLSIGIPTPDEVERFLAAKEQARLQEAEQQAQATSRLGAFGRAFFGRKKS